MLNLQRAAHRLRAFSRSGPSALVVLLALGTIIAGCSEDLDSGKACGTLCPLANEQLRDTVLDPVALDTTLAGFPVLGTPRPLLLAVDPAPDSLDVRAVVRFDSLPSRYAPPSGGDSVAITAVDSTFLTLRLDTTGTQLPAAATLEAYDVDTPTGEDTATATLAPLFRPDRRLGTLALDSGATLGDSIRVPISDSAFATKATAGDRLRIGLRLVSTGRARVRVLSARTGTALSSFAPTLSFDAADDTVYRAVRVSPSSSAPTGDALTAAAATDAVLVVQSPRSAVGSDLLVGGVPGRRTLLRFNLPIQLTDSTDVVRAVLELTQRPVRYLPGADSVVVRSEGVLATTTVTDLVQVAALAAPVGLGADTVTLSPADSGLRSFSLVTLIRAYRALPATTTRAVTLRSLSEGAQTGEIRFFSSEAPAAVRPRLRLTYIPRTSFGVP